MEISIAEPKKDLVREHVNLVKVLRTGNRKQLDSEAADQAKELSEYRKDKGRKTVRGKGRR